MLCPQRSLRPAGCTLGDPPQHGLTLHHSPASFATWARVEINSTQTQVKGRAMKLLTKAQESKLLKNGAEQDGTKDHTPVVKWFTPDGQATWLISEIDPNHPDIAFGLCDLGTGFPELGDVSITEIKSIRGQLGLAVERDLHFQGKYPLSIYADAARQKQAITLDSMLLTKIASAQQSPEVETGHMQQEKAGRLVTEHVYQNQTSLILDHVFAKDLSWKEAIENRYDASLEAIEEYLMYSSGVSHEDWHELPFDERETLAEKHGFVAQEQEIYEWWLVSQTLYERLKEFNHPVLAAPFGYYWGRTCSGQAIKLGYS